MFSHFWSYSNLNFYESYGKIYQLIHIATKVIENNSITTKKKVNKKSVGALTVIVGIESIAKQKIAPTACNESKYTVRPWLISTVRFFLSMYAERGIWTLNAYGIFEKCVKFQLTLDTE